MRFLVAASKIHAKESSCPRFVSELPGREECYGESTENNSDFYRANVGFFTDHLDQVVGLDKRYLNSVNEVFIPYQKQSSRFASENISAINHKLGRLAEVHNWPTDTFNVIFQ